MSFDPILEAGNGVAAPEPAQGEPATGPEDNDDILRSDRDDKFSFFARGRDIEGINTIHKFTRTERTALSTFASSNYFPANSSVYREWVQSVRRATWEQWFVMALIGFVVAIVNIFLHQFISVIVRNKYVALDKQVEEGAFFNAWLITVGISVGLVFVSASLVVYVEPAAAASGVPEVIAFLNGVHLPRIFNVRTLCVKFVSAVCAVASGLPVGPEGPMIHMGAIIGAGVSQFRSKTLGFDLGTDRFKSFRNARDRRDFITAGVASGVAAAFGAPIGGLLFAFEEVASFWSQQLGWKTFLACMVTVFISLLAGSYSEGFELTGAPFGTFTGSTVLYETTVDVTINVLIVIPVVLIGVIGGVLGSIFTFMNVKINRFRRAYINPHKWLRVLEPCLLMLAFASIGLLLPRAFSCTSFSNCIEPVMEDEAEEFTFFCLDVEESEQTIITGLQNTIQRYQCPEAELTPLPQTDRVNATVHFNEFATIFYVQGEESIRELFSRRTYDQIGYGALFLMLFIYFLGAVYAAGTAVSSGLVVPMLLIGALYGRIVGLMVYQAARAAGGVPDLRLEGQSLGDEFGGNWAWIDPGVFALIGAGSFFGGVSRLTLSLTVIMIEISNDIHMLLPIMLSIIIAKAIADFTTHSLYHALLELKCMPFIDAVPPVDANLDAVPVSKLMTTGAVCIHATPTVDELRTLLNDHPYNGFPVVESSEYGEVLVGTILRSSLDLLLTNPTQFHRSGEDAPRPLPYELVANSELRELRNFQATMAFDELHAGQIIDLRPYVNESVFSIQDTFSFERAFLLFRSMGLRLLPVVDRHNVVVGVLTRKNLLGHEVFERLHPGAKHKH